MGSLVCSIITSFKTPEAISMSLTATGFLTFIFSVVCFFSPGIIVSFGLFAFGVALLHWRSKPIEYAWLVMLVSTLIGHLVMGLIVGLPYLLKSREIERNLQRIEPETQMPVVRSAYPGKAIPPDERPRDWSDVRREQQMLSALHQTNVERFINMPGFGIGRMQTPSIHDYQLPKPATLIPQPGSPAIIDSLNEWQAKSGGESDRLHALHHSFRSQFATPDTLGIEAKPKVVVGFLPHDIRENPLKFWPRDATLRVKSVELVGLLMAEEPRVYRSAYLPSMTEAKNAPTRPLDAFEKIGLEEISKGLSIYAMTHRNGSPTKMVGAIRAKQACLKCHDCMPGELLGLFTYTLKPD